MTIRILIADDHQLVAEGLRSLVETQSPFKVVGHANNGMQAIELALELKPDIILMDMMMPELNGIESTRIIIEQLPDTKIIVFSMHGAPDYVNRAIQAGAIGYVLKRSAARELFDAINEVLEGRRYLSEKVAESLAEFTLNSPRSVDMLSELSRREKQVLFLIAESHSMIQISELLNLSPKTVETYKARLYKKLNVTDVAALVKSAIKGGLVNLSQ